MSVRRLLIALSISTGLLSAHDIITTNLTFTRDVSRIFARHCLSCHGANASIPLVTYEQARPWAVSIKEQVLSRAMPPWGAVKGFGNLSPDNGLSQEDILILAAWVVGGAPKGNPELLPTSPISLRQAAQPVLADALQVDTRVTLRSPLRLAGIRPLPTVEVASTRVVARWPDGRVEPLVWLYRYDPKFAHTFTFQKPIEVPAGAVIEASAPLRYTLETIKAPLPGS
ncbi:MAG TPA: cytochrome c [Bryobacteraceae bacterium]|nr:cytochrome c [Bryobacteraceae bacterium]